MELSRDPEEAPIEAIDLGDFGRLVVAGNYRHLVLHERGFYLVNAQRGALLYNDALRRMSLALGVLPVEVIELQFLDYPGNPYDKAGGGRPVRVPWSSYEVEMPDRQMPDRFFMAVFDLEFIHEAWDGPTAEEMLPSERTGLGEGGEHVEYEHREQQHDQEQHDQPQHGQHEHKEMPGGASHPGAE